VKYIQEETRLVEQDLEYRKVQCTGRASYIVTLPKEWVQDMGLKAGHQLAIKKQEDSSLLLIPRTVLEKIAEPKKSTLNEATIHITSKEDPKSLVRKIISLYVVGIDLIHIKSRDGEFASEQKTLLKDAARRKLLGAEVISESPNEIVLQILINHPEFPIQKAIKRMFIIALSMNKDAISALKSLDKALVQNIIETDDDVDRLDLYVIRQLKYTIQKNQFEEIGLKSPKEFLGYRLATNAVRGIADLAEKIAENILTMDKPVNEKIYNKILTLSSYGNQLFEDAMISFFKRDYQAADAIISRSEKIADTEKEIFKTVLDTEMDAKDASSLRLILDSSRRMIEYSKDIAEVTLNRTVEETYVNKELTR